MKKVVRILLAILMVMCLTLGITACKSECEKGNHVWETEGKVTKEATCTAKGVMTYKCSLCDETTTKPIDMIDHTPIDASVPAACTTAGTTGATKCSVCGTSIAAGTTIPAKGHAVTTWTPCENDDAKHEGTCTVDGCGVKVTEAHTPNEAGAECTKCHATLGGEQPHSHNFDETIADNVTIVTNPDCTAKGSKTVKCSTCDEVKTVEIPALDHDWEGADWTPCADNATKHERTCQREICNYVETENHESVKVDGVAATCTTEGKGEGRKCSVCDYVITEGATIPALKHDYTDVDWTLSATDATKHERTCIREGCGYVATESHTWDTEWDNDSTKHWHDCTKCTAVKDEAEHYFGEEGRDLTCNVCDEVNPSSEFNYVAVYALDGVKVTNGYAKLADAVHAIGAIENVHSATISVRGDGDGKTLNGLGVVIPEGHNITIDLNGATYVVASEPVGSTGTETNGLQILKNSNVTIKDGTITSASGSGVKLLIQNYANLTLDGVTVDGTRLDSDGINCTLSNNCGTVVIKNKSKIIAKTADDVAFDVYYNMGGNYPQGVSVTVDDSCRITGMVAYGSAQANVADLATKAVLTLPLGTYKFYFTKNVTDCTATGITVDGETLTHKPSQTLTYELVGDVHKHYATCSLCNSKIYSDCTWDGGEVTQAPNCVAAEETTYTCTACGHKKMVTGNVDDTKHDFDATIEGNVTVTKPATCTEKGTMTVKCSRCNAEKTGVEIPMVAHQYDTAKYVSVSATEHAYKCANCDDYKDAVKHTYTANHCESCGGDITQKQIVDLMADLSENGKDGDYLITGSSDSTFVLTGIYGGQSEYKDNYKLVDDNGDLIVICYKLDISDLIVGDKITVTGKIKNYKTTIEFDEGCTYDADSVVRGQSNVTVNVVDDEGNAATDKANYTLTGVTGGGKATNKSAITLTVNVDSDWIVNKVSADIVDVDYDAATKTYSLTIEGDTVITIQVKQDDGKRTYDAVVTYDVSKRGENDDISGIQYETISIALTGGAFNGDQLRLYASQTMTITAPADISKIVFTTVSGSNSGANLGIVSGGGEISGSSDTVFTWTGIGKEIKFNCKTQTRILSIEVTYSMTVECRHIDAEGVTAKAAACGEIGFKVNGIYCSACGHFTTNGWANLADEQIIPELDHDYESVNAVTATCQVKAVDAHYACKNCGKLFIDENETKKEVTIEAITGEFGDHNYGNWTHVADTETHSKTCSVCNDTVTDGCASEIWIYDTENHWKGCSECYAEFGREPHTGDNACTCGTLKLTYKVVDSEGAVVADAINTTSTIVTGYAKAGDDVSVTIVAADTHRVNTVASDGLFTAKGNNVYTGKLAANGEIVVTVEAQQSATYKELIADGISEDKVVIKIGESAITAGQTLSAGDVIDIAVDYDSANYDLTVVVNQGNDSTIEMTAGKGSYTCLNLGEVTITVTLTAKVSVTVTGNGTVTVNGVASDEQKWSKGTEIAIVATANKGYALDETPFTVTAGATLKRDNVYTVTGDVTITVNTVELVTVMITKDGDFNTFNVAGAGIVDNVEFDEDGMAMIDVKANTQITISAIAQTEGYIVYAAIGETKTAFVDNAYTVTVTEDLEITVTAEEAPDKKAFVKLTTSNKDDLLKDDAVILIVYETGGVCFDGSLNTLDANSNNTSVTIENNQIEYTDDLNKVTFTIESVANGNIKSASGYYIGTTSYANSLVSNKTTKYTNTINVTATSATIVSSNNCTLNYNKTSGTERFRYYKTGQESTAIYVLTTVA